VYKDTDPYIKYPAKYIVLFDRIIEMSDAGHAKSFSWPGFRRLICFKINNSAELLRLNTWSRRKPCGTP